jgi:cobalt-zinc-cadmium efflux system protein
VHVWSIDEHRHAVEAHVVVADGSGAEADAVRMRVKRRLEETFGIGHSTIEIEQESEACGDAQEIGHAVGRH